MIQRVVLVRLKEEYRQSVELVAEHTRDVLGGVEMVRGLVAGVPADGRTRSQWDLVILVRLDDLEAVEAWRVEPTHRKYVDLYLQPMLETIRVWNFEVPTASV